MCDDTRGSFRLVTLIRKACHQECLTDRHQQVPNAMRRPVACSTEPHDRPFRLEQIFANERGSNERGLRSDYACGNAREQRDGAQEGDRREDLVCDDCVGSGWVGDGAHIRPSHIGRGRRNVCARVVSHGRRRPRGQRAGGRGCAHVRPSRVRRDRRKM